jgi:hypothetical protein
MSIPKFTLALKTIKSLADSTEVGNDEPYLLVIGVDFTNVHALVIDTTRYGPFSLGESETATTFAMPFGTPAAVYDTLDTLNVITRRPFWGLLNRMPTSIVDIEKMAFVMILMENDDGDPQAIRDRVHAEAKIVLTNLVANFPLSPNTLRKHDVLITLVSAIHKMRIAGKLNGGLNNDDFVHVQPLVIEEHGFKPPLMGRRDLLPPVFSNGPQDSEGIYRVTVEMAFS